MSLPFTTKVIMYFKLPFLKQTSQAGTGSVGADCRHTAVGAVLGLSGNTRVLARCPCRRLMRSDARVQPASVEAGRGPVSSAAAAEVP